MILVFGSTGQVARELREIVPKARFLARSDIDLLHPLGCADAVLREQPAAVINAAAYTAVDKAEDEEELAMLANAEAPGAMARACAQLGIPLVHISTDYVFDGSGDEPHRIDSPIAPLGAYGRSKAAGEALIRASDACHAILRTSWIFSAHGDNFVKTMLRLSQTRDRLTIVADQVGGPTPAAAIAKACLIIACKLRTEPELSGTYHFAGTPEVSWADFAREIFAQAGRKTIVEDIPTSAYPTPAARPLNSRMDCSQLTRFGIVRPDWRIALKQVIQAMETA